VSVDAFSDAIEPILNPSYQLHGLMLSSANPVGLTTNDVETAIAAAQTLTVYYADYLPRFEVLDSYYRGYPPLPMTPVRMTTKFEEMLMLSRSNWCGLVVDVVDERLRIESAVSSANPVHDDTLWGYWEANNMPLHASEVHVEALKLGVSYVSVWPNQPGKPPRILGESPLSTYVDVDDVTHEPVQAIRIWRNHHTGVVYADYTNPDFQLKLVAINTPADPIMRGWHQYRCPQLDFANLEWMLRTDVPEAVLPNAIGKVPYVVMSARPDLLGCHHSEIEGLLPIQDRINKTTFDRLVTQEMTAFPQRWVTGIDIPTDSEGKPREPFDAAVDRVWTLSAPDGRFGQFPQSSPDGYLAANTADIQALATQSRTPPHYLIAGMGVFPSGESVRATEYGLSRKVSSRQLAFGDPWADVLRLCALADGNAELADDAKVAIKWADVEASSEAEVADAILKLSGIPGIPIEPLLARAGLDPSTFGYYASRHPLAPNPATVPQVDAGTAPAVNAATPEPGTPILDAAALTPGGIPHP